MPWISLLKSMRRSAWVWTCWKRSIKHLGQDIMIRSDNNYNAQQRSFRRPDQRSTMLNDTRQFLLYDVAKRHSRSKWSSWICLSKFVPLSSSIPPLTLRQLRSDSQWYCLYSGGITQAVPTNARRPLCPPHVFANVANSHQKHTFQDSTYAPQRNVFLVNSKKKGICEAWEALPCDARRLVSARRRSHNGAANRETAHGHRCRARSSGRVLWTPQILFLYHFSLLLCLFVCLIFFHILSIFSKFRSSHFWFTARSISTFSQLPG